MTQMDYADFESGFKDEIEREFLKRMNIVKYDELSSELIDQVIFYNRDVYDEVVDDLATDYGVYD